MRSAHRVGHEGARARSQAEPSQLFEESGSSQRAECCVGRTDAQGIPEAKGERTCWFTLSLMGKGDRQRGHADTGGSALLLKPGP